MLLNAATVTVSGVDVLGIDVVNKRPHWAPPLLKKVPEKCYLVGIQRITSAPIVRLKKGAISCLVAELIVHTL